MQVGFHVQSELLLARSFYMRKIKVFCEKYVSCSVTSPSCSFGCECMRSYCTSWWGIFKWNENSDWSHVKGSSTFIVTRLHRRLFCSSSQLPPLLPSLYTYMATIFQENFDERGRRHCNFHVKKRTGTLVVSFRGVHRGLQFMLGYSGRNAIIFSRLGIFKRCTR